MSVAKQVREIAIELNSYNDGYVPVSGYPKTYEIWNYDARMRTDWLGGSASTRALSGFDRVNPGGYRADIRITFRNSTSLQADAIRKLLNDIFADPMHPRIVKISPNDDINLGVECNLRSSAFGLQRELTVGRQAINMQFVGVERLTTIRTSFIVGFGFTLVNDAGETLTTPEGDTLTAFPES